MTLKREQDIVLSDEVKEAISNDREVVALESTIISHGLPYPKNIEMAIDVENIIRTEGAVPATIALINGKIRIGLTHSEIEALGDVENHSRILKASRRDIAYILSSKQMGTTTVSGTMISAQLAGIRLFVTGGIGGVHRDAENTFDISADLQELGRTSVAVICAGAKSILDVPKTLEVLETLGVPVIGYKTDKFPEFYCSEGPHNVDYRMDDLNDIAKMLQTKWLMGISGGALIANPIPIKDEVDRQYLENMILEAIEEANKQGIKGKSVTPFLLKYLSAHSEGKTLKANLSLIKNNAKVGAQLAVAMQRMNVNVL